MRGPLLATRHLVGKDARLLARLGRYLPHGFWRVCAAVSSAARTGSRMTAVTRGGAR
jgi:hypothetical protein